MVWPISEHVPSTKPKQDSPVNMVTQGVYIDRDSEDSKPSNYETEQNFMAIGDDH